jgi:hypothetical protein
MNFYLTSPPETIIGESLHTMNRLIRKALLVPEYN